MLYSQTVMHGDYMGGEYVKCQSEHSRLEHPCWL